MGLFKPNVEKLAQKSNVKGLIKALLYEKDVNIRCAAAEALGKIGDPQAVEPLLAALRDTDKYVQESASQALVQIGEKTVSPPLINAAWRRDIEIVKLLLENGADVNARDISGITVLMHVSRYGYTEIAKMLIEKGADVNAKDNEGRTALIQASGKGHKETAKLLIEKGTEEISVKEQIIKEQISIKKQISEYISDYSESAMIEELAKMLAVLYKRSNQEYESDDKVAYEITLGLIKYIGEKLNLKEGEELMRQVLTQAGSFGCNARFIEREWSGIGTWRG